MQIEIFSHDGLVGNRKNVYYPDRHVIDNVLDMSYAMRFDHVCAEYVDNRRSSANFVKSNVLVMDCDNEHSDEPEEWVDETKLMSLFPNISFIKVPSRNNMKEKGGKSARPRFHMYFPISEITSEKEYAALKRKIQDYYPFFDKNALDSGRFIFGSSASEKGILWYENQQTIDVFLKQSCNEVSAHALPAPATETNETPVKTVPDPFCIPEGTRNSTLFRFALRVMKQFGISGYAKDLFYQEAEHCKPSLSQREIASIWKSASRYCPMNTEKMSLRPEVFTDLNQAKMFVREYGNEIHFTNATELLRYDGRIWVPSDQYAIGAIEEFVELQTAEARDLMNEIKNEIAQNGNTIEILEKSKKNDLSSDQIKLLNRYKSAAFYYQNAIAYQDSKNIHSILVLAKPMVRIDFSEFDKDPELINTPDATYYLPDGLNGKREHKPEDHITKMTLVNAGDKGKQIWFDALDLFFSGNTELIEYVQLSVGTAAFGKVLREGLIIAIGDGGNGKSTFWNTIMLVLGTYGGIISTDILLNNSKVNLKAEIAELPGKRLVIAKELDENQTLSTSMVKQICSTDPILGERKFKAPFFFIPSHTAILYTNHLPNVKSVDNGIWRRLTVIPFDRKIPANVDIKNYTEYLIKNAGPAILSWIIEGAQKAYQLDFNFPMPKVVETATAKYREDNDWIGDYIDSRCVIGNGVHCGSGELYDDYKDFCQKNGEFPKGAKSFYAALETKGFTRRKTNKGKFLYGIGILYKEAKLGE